MSRFDDELDAAVADGSITAERAAVLRDASPLKAERDTARADADAALTENAALRAKVAADVFTKLAIPGTPDAYNLPSTVNIADEAQVTAWAQSMNLITVPGPDPAEQQAHERMNAATSAANTPPPVNANDNVAALRRELESAGASQMTPGSALYQKAMNTLLEGGVAFGDAEILGGFERDANWGDGYSRTVKPLGK